MSGPIADLEAERGALARSLEGDASVARILRPEYFFSAAHAATFDAIVAVGSNPAAVERYLAERRVFYLHNVDAAAYLGELLDRFAWGKDTAHYVACVLEAWRARTIEAALAAAAVCVRRRENVDRVVADLGRAIRAANADAGILKRSVAA